MIYPRWLLAVSILMLSPLISASAAGSSVRDQASMFSPDVVKKAQAHLDHLERATHIPVVIETIDKVPGLDAGASHAEREEAINSLAVSRDNALKDEGIYLLISKNDHLNSNVLVRERFASVLPKEKRVAIGRAFIDEFKKKEMDAGLIHGVQAIEHALEGASVGRRAARVPGAAQVPLHQPAGVEKARGGQSAMGTFLLIMVGIFGVLLVLRLLGGLLGRSAGGGYPNQMGGMGMRGPGMGPGGPGYYGGAGYGGRGGGFFSGMLGGLGGALAGNWLYDQFSGGRHGGVTSSDAVSHGDYADQGGDAIVGADDNPGGGTSWDDGGAADTGGGDWGGGGGDWGGGGGDWGGGGGDWGGGGGGGGGDW
jgi:hypothetical protein